MSIRCLGQLAVFLVVIFACLAGGALFPWQPLDAGWQARLTGALLNAAPLPLLALALLQIAVVLDPDDPLLEQRQRLFSQLAVAASLGFLLLLPLQVSAVLHQQHSLSQSQLSRITNAEKRLASLRAATGAAISNAALNAELQKLEGPVLSPADLAHPLPLLKAQVGAVFDQAQVQISRDRAAMQPTSTTSALPELLRSGMLSLACAGAFAAFARRPHCEFSLLEEIQALLSRRPPLQPRGARARSDDAFIRELQGEHEDL